LRVILLGPPGVGKGTQGERIAARYGVPHISSGDVFREEAAQDTGLGSRVRGYLDAGDLVPDDLVLEMVRDRIAELQRAGGDYILDGFPRTIPQAEAAAKMGRSAGLSAQAVLYLDAPAEVLLARMAARGENRSDDSVAVARHRLEVYTESTKPLLDYYAGRGLVITINGAAPVDAVSEEIYAALDPIAARPA
jgi:adenylate kinase